MRILPRFRQSGLAFSGALILALLALVGLLAPILTRYDPLSTGFTVWLPPDSDHWLGTTALGQDIFAQLIYGARLSLFIGLSAGLISTVFSVAVGLTGAYVGGWIDDLLSLVTGVLLVMPGLPLLIVASAFLHGHGFWLVIVVIGFTGWAWGARVLRSQALALRSRDYVTAALGIGESWWRIVFVEIFPNMAGLIAANFFGAALYAVLSEAALSFIGLGDVSQITWGTMLYWAQARGALLQGAWWWIAAPGLCIASVGTSFALLNFAIDAVSNPRLAIRRLPRSTLQGVFGPRKLETKCVFTTSALRAGYASAGGAVEAVRGVDLEVGSSEVIGIAGESGCGKTTLAFAATRLLEAPGQVFSGFATIEGNNLTTMREAELRNVRWRDFSFVFQASMNSLNPVIRVREQIYDAFQAHGVSDRSELDRRSKELFDAVRIEDRFLDAYPHELSGGMKQRVVIAMAMALRPKIIFMDEPTTALDVIVQRQIVEEIHELRRRYGVSIVMITHDLSLLLEICDRIVIMYAGEVVEVATPAQLLAGPAHPYSKSLLTAFPPIDGPKERRSGLAGRPPALTENIQGCAFFARCSLRTPGKCDAVHPSLEIADDGRRVACLNGQDVLERFDA
jgi:oligopeptide/dipeptide ABC transporter ATP-binding protein